MCQGLHKDKTGLLFFKYKHKIFTLHRELVKCCYLYFHKLLLKKRVFTHVYFSVVCKLNSRIAMLCVQWCSCIVCRTSSHIAELLEAFPAVFGWTFTPDKRAVYRRGHTEANHHPTLATHLPARFSYARCLGGLATWPPWQWSNSSALAL